MKNKSFVNKKRNKKRNKSKKIGGATVNNDEGIKTIVNQISKWVKLNINTSLTKETKTKIHTKIASIMITDSHFLRMYGELESDKENDFINLDEYNLKLIFLLNYYDILSLILTSNEIKYTIASTMAVTFNKYERPSEFPLSLEQVNQISLKLTIPFLKEYITHPKKYNNIKSLNKLLYEENIHITLIMYPDFDVAHNMCTIIENIDKSMKGHYGILDIKVISLRIPKQVFTENGILEDGFIKSFKDLYSMPNINIEKKALLLLQLIHDYKLYDVFYISEKLRL
jgi:hypothetical protein